VRLRLGVVLWLLSWVPFAVLVGATTVRSVGWRQAPSVVWTSLVHGDGAVPPAPPDGLAAVVTAQCSSTYSHGGLRQ
jgi:hypothetical protein